MNNTGCFSFGPQPIQSPDIWSPTIGPQLIGPSGQTVPNQFCPLGQKFGPRGQMIPNQFGPPGQMVPKIFCLSRGTGCDDLGIWGPNWLGTICPGGPNFWGPFVHGDRIGWGPFVQRDQSIGDQLWGTKCPGTICVWDQMCHRLPDAYNWKDD